MLSDEEVADIERRYTACRGDKSICSVLILISDWRKMRKVVEAIDKLKLDSGVRFSMELMDALAELEKEQI
jgi:hypothetical protein